MISHGDPPRYLTFASLVALGIPHATTTRHFEGATSFADRGAPFRAGAGPALAPAGLDVTRAAYARQVHGADVLRVRAPGFAGTADVLATTEPRLPLAIFTADCLAVTLVDADAGVLVVAHTGWRGTVRGVTGAALAALAGAGGHPDRARAVIGPSIGPCCYEVDEPVIAAFEEHHGRRWREWTVAVDPGKWMLDLWRANEDLLAGGGIPPGRIENPRLCTACHPELLYSYRTRVLGRLATIAALP